MGLEYTLVDWLQVLLLLVGMPFISAFGAALGLLGRIRRGGFLPSVVAGLAGAAIASGSLYLGIWTLRLEPTIDPKVFLEIYETGYQRYISIACLISAAVIAFLFAIAWRLRKKPLPSTQISISLRTALVVQVLSLLCVGSWCGLRLLVINSANPRIMTQRIWSERGWDFHNGDTLSISRSSFSAEDVKAAMSPENLLDIARFPGIQQINIAGVDLDSVDISPLSSVKQLSTLGFTACNVNDLFRKDILQFNHLRGISLSDLTTAQPTLGNLANLPKLTWFTATNVAMERDDLRRLFDNCKIEHLTLFNIDVYRDGEPIDLWPAQTRFIYINGGNLKTADLSSIGKLKSLTHLHLVDTAFDDSVLEHYQDFQKLQYVSLPNKNISPRGFEIIAKKMQPPLLAIAGGELPPSSAELIGGMAKLQTFSTSAIMCDQDLMAIAKCPSLINLTISSPGISEEALMTLASCAKLKSLQYPSFRGCLDFETRFAAERIRLTLPGVQLTRGPTIDAQGLVTTIAP